MRLELRELAKRLDVTTLFVTHEQIEALTMSDVMAVMKDGLIIQEGTPSAIYGQPGETFVADFIGKTNFLKAKVLMGAGDGGIRVAKLETPIGPMSCRMAGDARQGDAVTIAVRPENVEIKLGAAMADNSAAGEVDNVVYLGNLLDCVVNVGGEKIRVQLHPSQTLSRGDKVSVRFPVEHCLVLPS
jgi:iron(III) transport system ATP-binding protein